MFELLNEIEDLTIIAKKEKNLMSFINQEVKKMNINIRKTLILGKTYRSFSHWNQQTYLGVINDYFYFYVEVENNHCTKIIVEKNASLVFDYFYSRELIKNEKEQSLKEIKSLLLYKKLQDKLFKRDKEKLKKI